MAFEHFKSFVRSGGTGGDATVPEGHEHDELARRVAALYGDDANLAEYLSRPSDELASVYALLGPHEDLRERVHGSSNTDASHDMRDAGDWRDYERARKGLTDGATRGAQVFAPHVTHDVLMALANQSMDAGNASEVYRRAMEDAAAKHAPVCSGGRPREEARPAPVSRYVVDRLRAKYGIEVSV